jgi:glycosyltransferase involved in cell wall biosynthesis
MTKNKPTFSIIIPVYSEDHTTDHHFRGLTIQRAIKSIINQQYPYWELILVEDGCSDGFTPWVLDQYAAKDKRIKVIHQANQNRAIARNAGMDAATGEWICWLDSDDEYVTYYLRELTSAIKEFPDYKIFNYGSIVCFSDHQTRVREAFKPAEEGQGHEWFRSGHIASGSFAFKRSLWKSKPEYRIPDEVNPYEFAAKSLFPLRFSADEPYVDDPTEAFQDGVYRHGLSIGNPWGDDFIQFYRLTRDNKSKPLDVLLYVQYVRAHEAEVEYFGQDYNIGDEPHD